MGRACSVCSHPRRREIDRMLLNPDLSDEAVARATPGVHVRSLRRHRSTHLAAAMQAVVPALDKERALEVGGLAGQMDELRLRAMSILDRAETSGNHKSALLAIREARSILEALARFSGQDTSGQTVINVISAPSFLNVQGVILQALGPFPEARLAVASALEQVRDAT